MAEKDTEKKVAEAKEEKKAEPAKKEEPKKAEAPKKEEKKEEPKKEEKKEAVPEKKEDTKKEEAPKEEKKEAPKKEEKKDDKEVGTVKTVTNLRIYTSPAKDLGPFLFTGNIIVGEKAGDLRRIEYVKAGFGKVIGYTDQL